MVGFRDRDVVVTGGTGALGAAVVRELLAGGANCYIPYYIDAEERNFPHRGHARVKLIGGANLASQTVVARLYEGVPKLWASIHLAGGFAAAPITETDEAELNSMIRTNLVTSFLCCAAAVRAIRRAGGGGGRIVNVAARPALEPRLAAGSIAYAASKAGVVTLTQALAAEVANESILVNAIAPSVLDTEANRRAMPKADHSLWPKVDEVAAVICELASPDNRITSGAIIPVYGRA
jgi:NAD(P)-dependent dehydrogenase (short-subunit alcohol dehydrogenase family)